ncbi:MBL fold metallo-hydrolase [uncultured Cetobacterium sp.]|uniref:MBL fold metallo-hydrolase n=1 Tax=uncultured Cetobacterium sp. TaxID=527638 RepID=UPI0026018CBB|nr:MBL fold metallo-hydrolase [uncultured Cetobacterium sp.]
MSKELAKEHGLSLYIETNGKKILFDVGESDKFWKNAKKLGVNLEEIDYLILSHGHKDHGGGLPYFLNENSSARIFCSEHYFDKHYKKILGAHIDIGIPYEYLDVERFNFVDGALELENFVLFHCETKENRNIFNESLYMKDSFGECVKDSFNHELNLIIKEESKHTLVTACAHKGLDNILKKAKEFSKSVECVVGGLHLSSRTSLNKNEEYIDKIIDESNRLGVKQIFSCHCTGEYGIKKMQDNGKFKTVEIQTGSKIKV